MTSLSYVSGWKWCALVSLAMVLLSLMPQMHFWLERGKQWQGAYTILQGDELLYSAYVNALIDGRPRRNDPATGQDDHPQARLPESLFSIQLIPPYAIAWLSRASGVSASIAFIALLGVGGLFASVSLYWLLASVTGESKVAAAGVLFVLCFGALAGGQGLVGLILKSDVRFIGLPFLRRYEPALPFPLFFLFCTLVWRALTTSSKRAATAVALLAGIIFGVLVFSYFYLWTAAAAWFACVTCLWPILRPVERHRSALVLITASVPALAALAVYAYLLSHLPSGLGRAQVLTFTHRPDLLRIPEIIGAFIMLVLIVGVRRGKVLLSEPKVIFAVSFALMPFVVFNQQVITGRSLQPYHYEVLIANYVVLAGLVTIVRFLQPAISRRTALLGVFTCLLWGAVEVSVPTPLRSANDLHYDEMVPVLLNLKQLAQNDGTREGLRNLGRAPTLVFSPEYGISRLLPTWAPQGLLLGTGSASFQSLPQTQRKEWLYMHFYYCGRNMEYLRELLNDRNDDPFLTYYAESTIFGPDRVLLFLGQNSRAVTQVEIEREVRAYGDFINSFSRDEALKRPITYAVTLAREGFDFSRIDLWYDRDDGQRVGIYALYRLKLRNEGADVSRIRE